MDGVPCLTKSGFSIAVQAHEAKGYCTLHEGADMDGIIESVGGHFELPGKREHLLRVAEQQGHLGGDVESPEQGTSSVHLRSVRSTRVERQCTRARQGSLGCIAGLPGLMLEVLVERSFLGVDFDIENARILALDDPDLFSYPIAYMWEPGFWTMTDEEAARFREYLLKGGFAIFDDFEDDQWNNFEAQMRRVLPQARFVRLDASHRVFDAFFRMKTIDFPHPMYGILPTYYGVFQDNDPSKRLMVIANHNHDVAEYWEYSGTGLLPIDVSNEAYKLGVNYMIYGLTH